MQATCALNSEHDIIEPVQLKEFRKGIHVPRTEFEAWLNDLTGHGTSSPAGIFRPV
jgi:hypothetical protein